MLRAVFSGRLSWQQVRMGAPWGQPALPPSHVPASDPRMSRSVPGQSPQGGHLLLDAVGAVTLWLLAAFWSGSPREF